MTAWKPLIVTLLDGSLTTSDSEAYRNETEAKMLLTEYPLEARRQMLDVIEYKRGPEAADRLRKTMQALHDKAREEA